MGFKDISEASNILDKFWSICNLYDLDCRNSEGRLCPFRDGSDNRDGKLLCEMGLFSLGNEELFQISSIIQSFPYNNELEKPVSNNQDGISW